MSAGDRLELPLACGREAPRRARDHLGAFLEAHGINGEVRQVALLIVSELVTNAVVHAAEPITLDVAIRDDTLRLEVCGGDDRAGVGAVRPPPGGDTNSRGSRDCRILGAALGRPKPSGRQKCVGGAGDVAPELARRIPRRPRRPLGARTHAFGPTSEKFSSEAAAMVDCARRVGPDETRLDTCPART
jgi:hypothetical protein